MHKLHSTIQFSTPMGWFCCQWQTMPSYSLHQDLASLKLVGTASTSIASLTSEGFPCFNDVFSCLTWWLSLPHWGLLLVQSSSTSFSFTSEDLYASHEDFPCLTWGLSLVGLFSTSITTHDNFHFIIMVQSPLNMIITKLSSEDLCYPLLGKH